MLILIVPFVSAAPPIKTVQTLTPTLSSLIITYPEQSYITQNVAHEFNFHVYNYTGATVINNKPYTRTDCHIHIYSINGSHFINKNLVLNPNGEEFDIDLSAANLSRIGIHPYIVKCNSTGGHNGYLSNAFEVTPDGTEPTDFKAITYGGLLMAIIGLITALLWLSTRFDTKDVSLSLVIINTVIKLFLILLAYVFSFFLISIPQIMLQTLFPAQTAIIGFFTTLMTVHIYSSFIILIMAIIATVISVIKNTKIEKINKILKEQDEY